MTDKQLLELLQQSKYDQREPEPIEQVVMRIQFKTIGSLGDFIMFSGRPKAGKSKFISGAIAASISRKEVFQMNIRLPDGKTHVAHFDTEQGKYSHFKMMKLIRQLGDLEKLPDQFNSYRCRSVAPGNILAIVEHYLKITPACGIVFLDGLLDTVESMNDEKHSSYIKRWLKRITEQYNVLLAGVIHRGFSNDKSIGQIGSEGEWAAQTVLLIEKNKDTGQYIMRTEYARDTDDIEPVAITYNKQMELWVEAEYIQPNTDTKPGATVKMNKRRPLQYDISEHSTKCLQIFNHREEFSYTDLIIRICEVYAVGKVWAKECIAHLETKNLIYRTATGFTNRQQGRLLKVE